jgi:Tetracyclin repressor-like, C-terminal domain
MLNWTSRWFVPGGILDADDVASGRADTILAGVLVKEHRSEATLPQLSTLVLTIGT